MRCKAHLPVHVRSNGGDGIVFFLRMNLSYPIECDMHISSRVVQRAGHNLVDDL